MGMYAYRYRQTSILRAHSSRHSYDDDEPMTMSRRRRRCGDDDGGVITTRPRPHARDQPRGLTAKQTVLPTNFRILVRSKKIFLFILILRSSRTPPPPRNGKTGMDNDLSDDADNHSVRSTRRAREKNIQVFEREKNSRRT